jgi:Ni/Co efflux regulator RcnB
VPRGRYFDDNWARRARSYYGHSYYGWNYPNWRRPYRPYRVGYILPRNVYWDYVPDDFYYDLYPPPRGCRYVSVDRDVLLIVVATGLVLDALVYDGDWR